MIERLPFRVRKVMHTALNLATTYILVTGMIAVTAWPASIAFELPYARTFLVLAVLFLLAESYNFIKLLLKD